MSRNKYYVITGSIASGKSTVSEILRNKGFVVLDADLAAADIYSDKELLKKVRAAFGDEVCNADGSVNRASLAERIFRDESARKTLNALTHPVIISKMIREVETMKTEDIVFLEIPLYFEEKERMDRLLYPIGVILVYIPEKIQRSRLMKRGNLSENQARIRIDSQMPASEKKAFADFLIENSGTREELENRVDELIRWIRNR